MKRKLSFVTNSSTTSFCAWGVFLDKYPDEDQMEVIENSNLKCETDGENIIIGLSPDEMKDNQTLLEFKNEIIKILNDIGINVRVNDIIFVSMEVLS